MPNNLVPPAAAFWHAVPLHYVPYLLHTGTLYAQTRLAALQLPIAPRPTATRRDRKLGLDRFVHFSFLPGTPLLRDKHQKGCPHVLLQFGPPIADLPGAGYLRFNAKAFRHRDAFAPITDASEKAAFLQERTETGSFPSAELLLPDAVPLAPHVIALHASDAEIAAWVGEVMNAVRPQFAPSLVLVSPAHFGQPVAPFDWEPFRTYARSIALWHVLVNAIGEAAAPPFPAPPNLPFD